MWVNAVFFWYCFFFQAEDGIRDLVRSRGLGDVYKRQVRTEPLSEIHWRFIKRIFDIIFSLIVFAVIFWWLFPLIFILNLIYLNKFSLKNFTVNSLASLVAFSSNFVLLGFAKA